MRLGTDPPGQGGGEPAEVVGRDRLGAVVVHRVVGQHGDRPAGAGLDREHGQRRVDRAGGRDRVGVLVAGVHVGPDGPPAERVVEHLDRAGGSSAGRTCARDRRSRSSRRGPARGLRRRARSPRRSGPAGSRRNRRRPDSPAPPSPPAPSGCASPRSGSARWGCRSSPGRVALARSSSSRGIMQLSTTTIASRVEPSSRTRPFARIGSFSLVARAARNPPLTRTGSSRRDVDRRGPGAEDRGLSASRRTGAAVAIGRTRATQGTHASSRTRPPG